MGKSSAPAAPDYKSEAIATANSGKYSESTPYGTVSWQTRPGADPNNPRPGDYTRLTELSPEQQQLYKQQTGNQLSAGGLASQQLSDLSGGQQGMQDALYRRATQYYDQNFGNQEQQLRTQLANSGLAEGSEAYKNALGDFNQRRDTSYADAADRALVGSENAQTSATNRLASILSLSRGENPQSANSAGGQSVDYSGASQNAYNSALGKVNAENAQTAQNTQTAATLATLLYMWSDRRLKTNVVEVGKGYKGLTIYEYDIFDRRERGYMADEVEKVAPEAVKPVGEYKMVAYGLIGGRP